MDLVLGRGEYDRARGDFVPWRQVNLIMEQTKTDQKGFNLLSRPPLVQLYNWGASPTFGVFQRDGVFGGDVFAWIGTTVYRNGVALASLAGSGPVRFAASRNELVMTRGATAYSYNGTNIAPIAFPDGANVRSVAFMSGWFIFVRDGSDRYYWSSLYDARTIDPLDYATAESEGDDLLDVLVAGDVLYLLGSVTGETWQLTGDEALPWSRISQRNIGRGVMATGCAEVIDNVLWLIGSDGVIYTLANGLARVSDHALEEKLRQSASGAAYQWMYEGHQFFTIRIDDGTYAIDVANPGVPVKMQTAGRSQWAPLCAVNMGTEPLFGDDATGIIWTFGAYGTADSGQATFERITTAGFPLNTQPLSIFNVLVDGNSGSATSGTPMLDMRYSRDGGRNWSPWRTTSWGTPGQTRRIARFGPCGMFDPPGALFEFRLEENSDFRISNVRVNETLAGRSR